jgi:REP element-mobilizing transposase RayT
MNHKNRKNIRWRIWDYRWDAAYFITICTKNREHFFGHIHNEEMVLSNVGVLADVFWHEIKNHAKHITLDAFVVMPNHIHGILILEGNEIEDIITSENRFQNIGKNSISSIIGSYKSAVTKHANRLGFEFGWQSRFHDHVIRNEESFKRIQNYIINNPKNWKEDRFSK